MRETAPYPGSSSLSPEAREKVLQTFQHTLELARGGRNEEALLGCDFILKMDFRFAPARALLESLRGVSAGTIVDLAPFEALASPPEPARSAPAQPQAPVPIGPPPDISFDSEAPLPPPPVAFTDFSPPPAAQAFDDFAPPAHGAFDDFAPLSSPAAVPAALDSLGFDSFGSTNPFEAGGLPASPPEAAPPPFEAGPLSMGKDPFSLPSPDPFATPPAIPALHDTRMPSSPMPPEVEARPVPPVFGGPEGDPFAGLGSSEDETLAGFQGFGPAAARAAAAAPPPADPSWPDLSEKPAQASPPSTKASAPAATSDPRVLQFLKQGDDAMARGQIQEAIDLWSRVFLIDLSNDEASRRIDAAREKQAQTAQAIDVLLSEGIQLFDSKDLLSARSKFLDVLALSESEPTARNYLNQIESALAQNESAASPFQGSGSDFLGDMAPSASLSERGGGSLMEPGSSGEDLLAPGTLVPPSPRPSDGQPEKKVIRIDLRIVVAAIVAIAALAGGGLFLASRKKTPPPPPPTKTAAGPKAVGEDLIAKSQALFNQGKADEALQILVSIPDGDPRHRDALALIDKFKSSAVPGPSPAAPTSASVDEMRVTGFAAMSANRYIEAVKALDPVVKSRPDDTEAAQALVRAREHLSALASAVRSYNEQDYESAIKLLWDLRKKDMKNQDVEEFLFKSYFNEGVQDLQAGNFKKAATSFQEAVSLRPSDVEAARHLKFARKYVQGSNDILSRIYVKNAAPRP
jgi:tetratricopeptide (TPR) repeat protein